MLCDDFTQSMEGAERKTNVPADFFARAAVQAGYFDTVEQGLTYHRELAGRYGMFSEAMQSASRFVLSPMVVEAAEEFSMSKRVVEASLDYIFLPDHITWIEWRGGSSGHDRSPRHGLLLVGEGDGKARLSIGCGAYVFDSLVPGQQDMVLHEPIVFDIHDFIFKKVTVPGEATRPEDYKEVARLGRFLVCVLALINTPRVSQIIHHNIDEKLNRSRLKRGKVPLLSWRDVTIKPDAGWVSPNKTHEEGATGERRRHRVRTFMRLRLGKVEIVGPHWRGNREKGYVQHRHVVRMDGEEAGVWKGEPLPGTRIMKPGDEPREID